MRRGGSGSGIPARAHALDERADEAGLTPVSSTALPRSRSACSVRTMSQAPAVSSAVDPGKIERSRRPVGARARAAAIELAGDAGQPS